MTGVELIAAERTRQVEEEEWTPEHDDGHTDGAMVKAAVAYAMAPTRLYVKEEYQMATAFSDVFPRRWHDKSMELTETVEEPGRAPYDRVTDPIGLLVKAGALIAAEIDRLQRLPDDDEDSP